MADSTNERTGKRIDQDRGAVASGEERAIRGNDPKQNQDELDDRLDEGLEETFPSSDPVSVKITK